MTRRKVPILAVTNQKGGVGKTTTTINLAAALAELGQKTLIVDLDPQGNATTGLGVEKSDEQASVYDLILDDAAIEEAAKNTTVQNLDIVPASQDLSSVDMQLASQSERTLRLKRALESMPEASYSYVLIDCPPSLNLLTLNALVAANGVLVPLQCEFFALEGISQLLRTIGEVRKTSNPSLVTQGVVLTMYDRRNRLTKDVEADVRSTLGELVFKTVIPRNVRLSEAPSFGLPGTLYDPSSSGAIAYRALARELRKRS